MKGENSSYLIDNEYDTECYHLVLLLCSQLPRVLQELSWIFTESWIELTNNLIQSCPDRVTPPLPFSSGEEYLRLLKEAQKESNPSSLISSRRDSPKVGSPKSPPNSPNPEPLTNEEELRGVFINYWASKVSAMSQTVVELALICGDEIAMRRILFLDFLSSLISYKLPQLTEQCLR